MAHNITSGNMEEEQQPQQQQQPSLIAAVTAKRCCYFIFVLAVVLVGLLLSSSLRSNSDNDYAFLKTSPFIYGTHQTVSSSSSAASGAIRGGPIPEPPVVVDNNKNNAIEITEQKPLLLFPVIASNSTGAAWLLSQLSSHYPDLVCFAQADLLDPDWERLRRNSNSRVPPGCSYAFIRDAIQTVVNASRNNSTDEAETATITNYDSSSSSSCLEFITDDPVLNDNLPLVCQWLQALRQEMPDRASYDEFDTDAILLNRWIIEYRNDASLLLPPSQCRSSCRQHPPPPLQGIKVGAEWLPRWPPDAPWNPVALNLNATMAQLLQPVSSSTTGGGKMVYVHRSNYLARFRHFLRELPLEEDLHHDDMEIVINTEDMLEAFTKMEHFDATGAAWVADHVSSLQHVQVLTVDYEDCRVRLGACLADVLEFLGVNETSLGVPITATAVEEQPGAEEEHYSDADGVLDGVVNVDEVKEALFANGFNKCLGQAGEEPYEEPWLLIYETDPAVARTRQFPGIHSVQFVSSNSQQPQLQLNKWDAARALLLKMPPDRMVVLGDGERDVSTNYLYQQLAAFKRAFADLTAGMTGGGASAAVVVAASPHCCVNALTHIAPGDLFAPSGGDVDASRTGRACNSSDLEACPRICGGGEGSEQASPWQAFMKDLAAQRGASSSTHVYLDAGLMVGKAGDLLRILEMADIGATEDATAVLTALMHHSPDLILLDYEQQLFGRYRQGPADSPEIDDCVIEEVTAATIVTAPSDSPASMLKSLILQNPETSGGTKTPKFPVWGNGGIALKPILDHIQRVADKTGKLAGVDMSFGPEVPYFIDNDGLWSFEQIRNRTSPGILFWRVNPIEGAMKLGYNLLTNDENAAKQWPALHKTLQSGGFPFFGWYGDFQKCNYQNFEATDSIPMLTNSAKVGCDYAFPTPSYQQIIDARTDRYRFLFQEYLRKYPFESKIRKGFWRGTLSDNHPDRVFEHIRWRFCETVFQSQSDLFDVGLTRIPKHNHRAENNLTQVGGLASYISPMEDFQKYLAILDMDGNSWSSRFGTLLCYNSVVIKIESKYVDYFHYDLKPWTHYVPVRDDLSDLFETVAFVMDPQNAETMKDIIAAANQWCAARFHPTQMAHDMVDVFESYVRRLDLEDPDWPSEWNKKKADLLFASELDVVQL